MTQGKIAERIRRWKTATPPQYGERGKRGDEPPRHRKQDAGRNCSNSGRTPRGFLNRSYASLRTKRRPLAGPALQEVGKVNSLPARWESLQDKALAGDESYMGVSNRGLQAPLARNLLHLAKFIPLAAAFGNPTWLGKRAEKSSPPGEIYRLTAAFDNPAGLGKRAEEPSPLGEICRLTASFDISAGLGKRAEEPSPPGEVCPLATAFDNPVDLGRFAEEPSSPGKVCPLAAAFDISTGPGKCTEEPPLPSKVCPLATAFDISARFGRRAAASPCDCV